ncbi:MAG: hypothetical protein JSU70_23200 [Phycisphaerales bacterium]|nr:MAG: hypothetical protein JSU70_23200 [Phycisphaerales bacterium]
MARIGPRTFRCRAVVTPTVGCLLIFLPSVVRAAGPYEISWHTIDGGGGTSSGGPYTLTGTIGQPEADWCAGGPYELLGGFWPGGPVPLGECFPSCHEDYSAWVSVGKPECWCGPRQCHGDADDSRGGSAKAGYYYVGPTDLNVLITAWLVKEPPYGPGITSVSNGICADFAHDHGGSSKSGFYRVGPSDLNILIANWLLKEPPFGPGIELDCLDCP